LRIHLLLVMWFFFFHLTNIYLSLDWELGILLWFNRSHLMDPDARARVRVNFARRRAREISSSSLQETAWVSVLAPLSSLAILALSKIATVYVTFPDLPVLPGRSWNATYQRDVLIQRQREGALARLMNIKTASDS